jgi:hypothetical protein
MHLSTITERVTDPIVQLVIGLLPNDWLIEGARRIRQKQGGAVELRAPRDLAWGFCRICLTLCSCIALPA